MGPKTAANCKPIHTKRKNERAGSSFGFFGCSIFPLSFDASLRVTNSDITNKERDAVQCNLLGDEFRLKIAKNRFYLPERLDDEKTSFFWPSLTARCRAVNNSNGR